MNTNWSQLPNYTFNVNVCETPYDICNIMKGLGIDKYIYEIRCKNITVKYGMSADHEKAYGARLYRQIGHLPSWGNNVLVGPNGSDMLEVNDLFEKEYGELIDHKDITVTVWSFDKYPFRTINQRKEINDAEQELIDCHTKFYGRRPIGNIDDGKIFSKKTAPIKSVWDNMFFMVTK